MKNEAIKDFEFRMSECAAQNILREFSTCRSYASEIKQ